MRGLRIAVALLALAAAGFAVVHGCGEDGTTRTSVEPVRGEADGAPTDEATEEPVGGTRTGAATRLRAARPVETSAVRASGQTAAAQREVQLEVRVRAYPEGTPLAGARVVLPDLEGAPSATTDVAGRAEFRVPPGDHRLRVESPGRTTTPSVAHCPAPGMTDIVGYIYEVELPVGVRLEGRATDAATGRRLSGVRVQLFDGGFVDGVGRQAEATAFAELISDADGEFGIDGVAPSRPLTLIATLAGRARRQTSLLVPAPPAVARAELALEPGGSVSGVVRLADGAPAAGTSVAVNAYLASDPGAVAFHQRRSYFTEVADDGTWRIDGLDLGGWYVAEAWASDLHSVTAEVRPTAETPDVRCDLRLETPGTLRVEMTGTRGTPQFVQVFRLAAGVVDWGLGWVKEGDTMSLSPGRFRVEWGVGEDDGHSGFVREVRIAPGLETVVRVERPPVHRVTGWTVDAAGSPREGVRISLVRRVGETTESIDAVSGEDGSFAVEDVPLGRWTLEAGFQPEVRRQVVLPCDPLRISEPGETTLVLRLPQGVAPSLVRYSVATPTTDADGVAEWDEWSSGTTESADSEPLQEGAADWTGPTRVRVAVSGHLLFERVIDIVPGSQNEIVAGPLVPCPTLRGRVVDSERRPVPNADLEFAEEEPRKEVRELAETDGSGAFSGMTLRPGCATLVVSAVGFTERRVDVSSSGSGPVEVVLSRPARLSVRVKRRDGSPAAACPVTVRVEGEDEPWTLPATDHRGRTEGRVSPGRLRVAAGSGDPVAVTVAEGAAVTVDLLVP